MGTPSIRRKAKSDNISHHSINIDFILAKSSNNYKKLQNLYLQFLDKMVKHNSTYYHSFWRDLFVKKVVASLLSLSLVLSASVSALAAEPVKISKSSQKAAAANDPYEPNDDPAFASYINSNTSYSAEIGHVEDKDIFKFYAKPGELKFLLNSLTVEKGQFWVILHKIDEPGSGTQDFFAVNGNVNFTTNITKEGTYAIYIFDKRVMVENPKPIKPVPYAFKAIFNQ